MQIIIIRIKPITTMLTITVVRLSASDMMQNIIYNNTVLITRVLLMVNNNLNNWNILYLTWGSGRCQCPSPGDLPLRLSASLQPCVACLSLVRRFELLQCIHVAFQRSVTVCFFYAVVDRCGSGRTPSARPWWTTCRSVATRSRQPERPWRPFDLSWRTQLLQIVGLDMLLNSLSLSLSIYIYMCVYIYIYNINNNSIQEPYIYIDR